MQTVVIALYGRDNKTFYLSHNISKIKMRNIEHVSLQDDTPSLS
jgi:hypothetical protein